MVSKPAKLDVDKPPTVSVLMNCYNGEEFIRDSIDSVLAQTYQDFELVIWDNLSTDRSWEIVLGYGDPRIIRLRAPKHTTLAEARKQAFSHLRGRWVAILDVDDLWRRGKLEKQMSLVEDNPDLGFIYCKTNVLSASQQTREDHIFSKWNDRLPEGDIYRRLLRGNFIAIASLLLNKCSLQSIGGFSGKYPIMEDYYVTLNLARDYEVAAVQETLCDYRVHGANASLHGPLDTFEDLQIVRNLFPDPHAVLAASRIIMRHIKKCVIHRRLPQFRLMSRALV
ncbi:MAG: glycosyltransferase family 2 protein [bacterium]